MIRQKRFLTLVLVVVLALALVPAAMAGEKGKININTASVKQLTKLEKIGKKYAERIIAYREKNGPFKSPEDITKVKGIGSKTYELNKDVITVE